MKNQYLFFESQDFADTDLTDFTKTDTPIAKTPVHIYEFEYQSAEETDELDNARKLDELTKQFENRYPDKFQTILSESSQFFCAQLYPLIVRFETTLRRAIYISRALFENGNVSKASFLFQVDKKDKTIEEMDFGKIYEAIFTDVELRNRVKKVHERNLTKADLIKAINELPEDTLWRRFVGTEYQYIENSFLSIETYRNDVMHSHLIDYSTYLQAKTVLEKAIKELETVISDKLISNDSKYLNTVDIVEALGKALQFFAQVSKVYTEIINSDEVAAIRKNISEWNETRRLLLESYYGSFDVLDNGGTEEPQEEKDGAE